MEVPNVTQRAFNGTLPLQTLLLVSLLTQTLPIQILAATMRECRLRLILNQKLMSTLIRLKVMILSETPLGWTSRKPGGWSRQPATFSTLQKDKWDAKSQRQKQQWWHPADLSRH